MSLESELKKLNQNIETLVEALGNLPTGAGAAANAEAAGEEKEAAPAKSTSKASSAKSTSKASSSKGTSKKEEKVTEEDLRQAAGDFLGTDDEDEREDRKAWFKKNILAKHKVSRATDISEDKWADVIAAIKAEQASRDEAGSEEEEEGDLV